MLRRLTVVTALTAAMSIAAVIALATPALAKGPSHARISGPGLAHPILVGGSGEPGQPGRLGTLATLTGLFTVMFGPGMSLPAPQPRQLRAPPPRASLGPGYTISYTVPGVTPRPGEQFGRIRQYLYPLAAGGPLVDTPRGQQGLGGSPLSATGWLRASRALVRILAQLGVGPGAGAHPAAAPRAGSQTVLWLIAPAAAIVAVALAGTLLWLRPRRRLAPHVVRTGAVEPGQRP